MSSRRVCEERQGLSPRNKGEPAFWQNEESLSTSRWRCCRGSVASLQPRGLRICALTLVAFSAVCFLLCAYAVAMLVQFSPVYTPIRCVEAGQSFDDPELGDPIRVHGNGSMLCENLNPYPVVVSPKVLGRVLVNSSQTQIGSVLVDTFELPAHGSANMTAHLQLEFSLDIAMWFAEVTPVEVILDLDMNALANVGVIVGSVQMSREQVAQCGFYMEASMPISRGPAVCGRTYSEIQGRIPSLDSEETVTFSFNPDPKELDMIQKAMYSGCGLAIAIFGTLGFTLTFYAVLLLRRAQTRDCCCENKITFEGKTEVPEETCNAA